MAKRTLKYELYSAETRKTGPGPASFPLTGKGGSKFRVFWDTLSS